MNESEILQTTYIDGGIYCLKTMPDRTVIFLCEPVLGDIGKLVQYEKDSKGLYKKTGVQYFLTDYEQGDLKGYFVNRDNYEMVGRLDINYVISEDGKYILKGTLDV